MEAEIWQRLPEELLYVILARLPMRVLGKMRSVCKQWNYLLSSRNALQVNVPNWSLHSTPGFLIQIDWDFEDEIRYWVEWNVKDDVEYWVIEGCGSEIYKLPLPHHIVVGTCKGITCIRSKGDTLDLFIGIPGTNNWIPLPRPPISIYLFSGLTYDSSTGRCTLLLGYSIGRRIVISIYDSEPSAWTVVSTVVGSNICPYGKGIYCKGKFYWVCFTDHLLVAFNISDGVWTEIPVPQGCRSIMRENLCEYYGQLVVVKHKGCSVRMWKLNEAEEWCDFHSCRLAKGSMSTSFESVIVNSSGLIMAVDGDEMKNIWIYNWKGQLISGGIKLPGLSTSRLSFFTYISSFETNNLWWP